jgi:hypothetical protein
MDSVLKLQPHRTVRLQGLDDYGAAAALWGTSDTGISVSGVFRDLADFAVLVTWAYASKPRPTSWARRCSPASATTAARSG